MPRTAGATSNVNTFARCGNHGLWYDASDTALQGRCAPSASAPLTEIIPFSFVALVPARLGGDRLARPLLLLFTMFNGGRGTEVRVDQGRGPCFKIGGCRPRRISPPGRITPPRTSPLGPHSPSGSIPGQHYDPHYGRGPPGPRPGTPLYLGPGDGWRARGEGGPGSSYRSSEQPVSGAQAGEERLGADNVPRFGTGRGGRMDVVRGRGKPQGGCEMLGR